MNLRPSTVTTSDEGWTWLSASRRGAQLRQGLWSVVLSLVLIALAAAATLPPLPVAVPLVALVFGAGIWLAGRLWNRSHGAVAVSALGVAVRGGFDVAQISWPALDAVLAVPHGRRMRIVVQVRGGGRHETSASFTREAALAWLDVCAALARDRRMRPEPLPDAAGFRTG